MRLAEEEVERVADEVMALIRKGDALAAAVHAAQQWGIAVRGTPEGHTTTLQFADWRMILQAARAWRDARQRLQIRRRP